MNLANRTKNCNCGEVLFKITQKPGYVIYNCINCNNEAFTATYDKYTTLMSTCEKCGGDIFKARIIVYKENEQEYLKTECLKCGTSPQKICIDNYGNLIDEERKKFLILEDIIKEFKEQNEVNEETIEWFEEKVDNLEYDIREKEGYIEDLEYELDEAKRNIINLKSEIDSAENEIYDLKDRISGLEY